MRESELSEVTRAGLSGINGKKQDPLEPMAENRNFVQAPKNVLGVGQMTNNMERAVLQAWTHFPVLIFTITPLSPSLAL